MPEPAYLTILSGAPARNVIRTEAAEIVAGRVEGADLLLPAMEISRRHCRFVWDGKTCSVEDLGSTRGTRVNGALVSAPRPLKAGDRIALGTVVLQFGFGKPPALVEDASVRTEAGGLMLVKGRPADRIPCDAELTIGRDPGGEVVLGDAGVSRRHAQVQPKPGGGCLVRDLNSSAGSFVNGQRFDAHELTVGDRLQIGPFYFQYDGRSLVRLTGSRGSTVHARALVQRVGERTLLEDVTFTIAPSHFAGILGPSGAGKSTLLNTLAGLDVARRRRSLHRSSRYLRTTRPLLFRLCAAG